MTSGLYMLLNQDNLMKVERLLQKGKFLKTEAGGSVSKKNKTLNASFRIQQVNKYSKATFILYLLILARGSHTINNLI